MLINLIKICCLLFYAAEEIKGDPKILEYFQQPGERFQRIMGNRKTTVHRIHENGYPCERHEVPTEDGYIVTIFRIPYSPKQNTSASNGHRPKVFLQHGLLGTSDVWILNGPDYSLPYLLADRGYDVWLGNSRGNVYGRKHRNLTMSSGEFWRFSWHEIGYYDMAAMLDYVLAHDPIPEEEKKSLHYIGHSQGTTVIMVLLSLRPEYQKKLRSVNLMAPVIFLDHTEDRLLKTLSPYLGYHNVLSEQFGRREFMPFNELYNQLSYGVCRKDSVFQGFCSPMAFMIEGSVINKNVTALQLCLETHPGGISTEQLLHYMQLHYASSFRQYDFGAHENRLRYHQDIPPDYPLENVTILLHLWYGEGDQTVGPLDIQRFTTHLKQFQLHRIPDDLWSHGDYLYSMYARKFVNEPLMDVVDEYERNKVER